MSNNKGFTIVQTLVTIGLMAIFASGMASWLGGVSKHINQTNTKENYSMLAREARMKLGQKETCRKALGLPIALKTFEDSFKINAGTFVEENPPPGVDPKNLAVARLLGIDIGRGDGGTKGFRLQQENLKIMGIYPQELSDLKLNTMDDGRVYLTRLKMRGEALDKMVLKDEDIGPVYLITDVDKKVIECFAELDPADFLETSCLSVNGEYNKETKQCALGQTSLAKICLSFGGVFDSATGSCNLPSDGRKTCLSLGGTWSGDRCSLGSRDVASTDDSSGTEKPKSGSSWECIFKLRGEAGAEWSVSRYNSAGDCKAEEAIVKKNNPKASIIDQDKKFVKDPMGGSLDGDSSWACNFTLKGELNNTWSVTRYVASQADCAAERAIVEKNNPKADIVSQNATFTKKETEAKGKWMCYYTLKGEKGNVWNSERESTDSKSCSAQTNAVKANNPKATITKVTGPSFVKL